MIRWLRRLWRRNVMIDDSRGGELVATINLFDNGLVDVEIAPDFRLERVHVNGLNHFIERHRSRVVEFPKGVA